jgi:predicted transcriptional regulator
MNGAKGTRIVTKPSPYSLKLISYLLLIDDGLIEVNSLGLRSVHKTTQKGMAAIERFERFQEGREKIHA